MERKLFRDGIFVDYINSMTDFTFEATTDELNFQEIDKEYPQLEGLLQFYYPGQISLESARVKLREESYKINPFKLFLTRVFANGGQVIFNRPTENRPAWIVEVTFKFTSPGQ